MASILSRPQCVKPSIYHSIIIIYLFFALYVYLFYFQTRGRDNSRGLNVSYFYQHMTYLVFILVNIQLIYSENLLSFLPEASFGLRVLSLPASVCVCVSVCLCVNHLLVRAITRDPFKLGSPNLDQRCERPWLRSLLFWGAIDLDLQGQI